MQPPALVGKHSLEQAKSESNITEKLEKKRVSHDEPDGPCQSPSEGLKQGDRKEANAQSFPTAKVANGKATSAPNLQMAVEQSGFEVRQTLVSIMPDSNHHRAEADTVSQPVFSRQPSAFLSFFLESTHRRFNPTTFPSARSKSLDRSGLTYLPPVKAGKCESVHAGICVCLCMYACEFCAVCPFTH